MLLRVKQYNKTILEML